MGWLRTCALELARPLLWLDVGATLARVLVGVALATALGWVLGLALGRNARLWRVAEPLVDFLRAIPPVLAFPVCLVLFGYTEQARVAAIAFGTTGIVLLHVANGVARAPSARRDTARLAGLRGLALVWRVDVFEALPALFLGLRLALTAGLVIAVVSEMLVGAEHGLGARALDALIAYRSDLLGLVVLLAGGTGFALSALVAAVERRVVHWQR